MKETKIVYLHGFNSTCNSGTVAYLSARFANMVVAVDYDYISPQNAEKTLSALLASLLGQYNVICVGKSLGGFWANYLAEKYKLGCVLINPGLVPHTSLLKYVGENKNFDTGKATILTTGNVAAYGMYYCPDTPTLYKHILLGGNDTVIDHSLCLERMATYRIDIFPALGHNFQDHTAIADAIDRAITNCMHDNR